MNPPDNPPAPNAGVAPYFDVQVNGFAGVDFQDAEMSQAELRRAVDALLRHRTGGILLTLITDRVDAMERKLAQVERYRAADPVISAVIAGYHLEGPHLSRLPGFHGAHPAELMTAPDRAAFDRLQVAACGHIRLVTIAPELPGSAEYIAHVVAAGVHVAIGHSNASDGDIDAAIAAGLTLCTHLGNGVPMELPRHDNIIQRLLARDNLTASFIADGLHVPPRVLRNFVRAKPQGKVIFTTDCMSAAGARSGRFRIGRLEIEVGDDGVVREPGKPNFAGSSLTMDRAASNVAAWLGWSTDETAVACGDRARAAVGLPGV
jgi:N-acetylglucosamine-6-phosphate deacetylase